jgi:hypothetical protein
MIPLRNAEGRIAGHQARPDHPRSLKQGHVNKYETATGQPNLLDIPPGCRDQLDDPSIPIFICEGALKADAMVSAGFCAVSISGVWNWMGSNDRGGKTALAGFRDVAWNDRRTPIAFDSDAHIKPEVHQAMAELARYLRTRQAKVEFLYLPHGKDGLKVGIDDWLFHGGDPNELWDLISPELKALPADAVRVKAEARPYCKPTTLAEVETTFRRWIVMTDPIPLRAALGLLGGHYLGGDAAALVVEGGSGFTKTVIVESLNYAPDVVPVSAISGEAALLSGTPRNETAADATGGILRQIGSSGILTIKDLTTILNMNRDKRGQLLGAFREIMDGRWNRPIGAEGARILEWEGRCSLIAACMTTLDSHHAVMANFGNRFLQVRTGGEDRLELARRSLANRHQEARMKEELAVAVGGLFTKTAKRPRPLKHFGKLTKDDEDDIIHMANLISLARSPVERDHSGEIVHVGDPDAPTRVAKALGQIRDGLMALGLGDNATWDVLVAVALDSVPNPRRLVLLELMKAGTALSTSRIAASVNWSRRTVLRTLEDLRAQRVIKHCGQSDVLVNSDRWELREQAKTDAKAFGDLKGYLARLPEVEDDEPGVDDDE